MNMFIEELGKEIIRYDVSLLAPTMIRKARMQRHKNMIGKYVVITNGISTGKIVYLQDKQVSKKGEWSEFPTNAIAFSKKEDAFFHAEKLSFNFPRVGYVANEHTIEVIDK